jgi:hypothetical protein
MGSLSLNAILLLSLIGAIGGSQSAKPVPSGSFLQGLRFFATDTKELFEYQVGRDLTVRVRRAVDAQGSHFGWDLSVVDRRLSRSPNFLYECLCGHGPRPNDLYAWHFRSGPASDRILPIYGYPFELHVRFVDWRINDGDATKAQFTSGTIEIGWRRLAESNPTQRRVGAIK